MNIGELRERVKKLKEETGKENIHPHDRRLLEPYEMFGIECGSGWESLYRPIMDWIDKYNEENPGDIITITQIKEKFGRLEFYVDKYTEELHEMIDKARDESMHVCEVCGTRDNVGVTCGGWYKTICLDCLKKMLADPSYYKNEDKWKSNNDGKVYKVTKDGWSNENRGKRF